MEAVRESWTDERMDDLKDQVVEQGRRVDARFASLETRMDARFDTMQRTMIYLFAALAGLISGQTALLVAVL
jgi:hypothetical protein